MSLPRDPQRPVPAETARSARAAFPVPRLPLALCTCPFATNWERSATKSCSPRCVPAKGNPRFIRGNWPW